jgi:calcineurin-like phosphoesterase family protein
VWEKKHYGAWHLYGHSYGNLLLIEGEFSLDIGVDRWNYAPVSPEQILFFNQ